MDEPNHETLVRQFSELTGAAPAEATQYLTANRWDLSSAAAEYFTSLDERTMEEETQDNTNAQETKPYNGPRTLDGRPAPESQSKTSSSSRTPPALKKKGVIATLSSLSHEHTSAGHNDDPNDEDLMSGKEPRDFFAGGEKSGLVVQDPSQGHDNPANIARDILNMAKLNASRQGPEASSNPKSYFRGNGQTLGGDDTPSRFIPNSEPQPSELGLTESRNFHLWEDGFSIEDGPLHRFDDPQNAADLQLIRQGRAPLHLMNVRDKQPIDVKLIEHNEKYKPPPKTYKPFSGLANRLGSPIPGASVKVEKSSSTATASTITLPNIDLDLSQPTISIRIQLADGTRLPARFNLTHTIGHMYNFVERASPVSSSRPWVIATTFPCKNHTEKNLRLEEIPEFRKGGTAVQKMIN